MKENTKTKPPKTVEDLIRDLLIVVYASQGVPQAKIRELLGVDMSRVNRIVKNLSIKQNK